MTKLYRLLTLSALLGLAVTNVQAIKLDFGNTGDSMIAFDGLGNFTFEDSTQAGSVGFDFAITGSTGDDSAVGLLGNLGGSFAIGTISGNSAPVTGSGTLSITDASMVQLTATVDWVNIKQEDAAGGLNTLASINLSSISYGGSNADLLAMLSASQTGKVVVTFQWDEVVSLASLKTTEQDTSYSGSMTAPISVPDGGSMIAMLGMAVLGLGALRRKLQ